MDRRREAALMGFLAAISEEVASWPVEHRIAIHAYLADEAPARSLGLRGSAARRFVRAWLARRIAPAAEAPDAAEPDPGEPLTAGDVARLAELVRHAGVEHGLQLWRQSRGEA